jgi:hypothetical protein
MQALLCLGICPERLQMLFGLLAGPCGGDLIYLSSSLL